MYVGIDVGTGSLKSTLGTDQGIHTISEKYPEAMTSPGHHDINLFIESLGILMKKITLFTRESRETITGIGLCGHGPSFVITDSSGNALMDIVTWQDSGAAVEALELRQYLKDFSKDGTCSEAKLFRLHKERPELFSAGNKVLYPKDYLLYFLTGRLTIDFSTAATISFFDPDRKVFRTGETGIPESIFPEVVDPWEVVGETGTAFTRGCGLADDIPVISGGIDAWCEAIGAGAIEEGMLVDGTGTSTCITCCRKRNETPLFHVLPDRTLSIETMSSTGASIIWMKEILNAGLDEFSGFSSSDPVPVIFQPYLYGERSPVWDEKSCISITGLTGENTREDLIKSVGQGLAFGTRQCIELAARGSAQSPGSTDAAASIRAVGGGAVNSTLLQYKADISGRKYLAMKEQDAASLGAMILGAFGCGESLAELVDRWVEVEREFEPNPRFRKIWDEMYAIYSKYFQHVKQTEHRLFAINQRLKMA